jgi:ASCH domain-containing protein
MRQPFAELVLLGKKTIELRTWNTKFRGEFLIHAGWNFEEAACRKFNIDPYTLTRGAIVGKAYLYDVKEYKTPEEFDADKEKHLADVSYGKYGFLIKNPVRFEKPIPMKGQLNFFEVHLDGY